MTELIKLARPHQWVKNLCCFAGIFFGGFLFDQEHLLDAFTVFVSFCALSSAVYVFNDYHDRESDRLHPSKKNRPLVKGTVKPATAMVFALILLVIGFAVLFRLDKHMLFVLGIAAGYVVLNVGYSLRLKHVPLLDVNIIALGFVIRVGAGALGAGIVPTRWILLCTYFLALLIAFGKRRAELSELLQADEAERDGEGGERREDVVRELTLERRRSLDGYTVEALDTSLAICAVLVISTYSLYCVLRHEGSLILATIVPVVIGVFRYLSLTRECPSTETPELILLKDRYLQAAVALWVVLFGAVLYVSAGS